MKLEHIILNNLIHNEEYSRRVLPFLKKEYFFSVEDAEIFDTVKDHIVEYNKLPTINTLTIDLKSSSVFTEDQFKSVMGIIEQQLTKSVQDEKEVDWLIDNTEEFCQEKAMYNAMTESISIMNGDVKSKDKGIIPELLTEALAVTFDTSVGHNYLEEYDDRFKSYHRKEEKIPFDLKYLNYITKNGVSKKTLNVILAGTGVGKTLFMCHLASSYLLQGLNVLYITLEMAEEKIAERIDANILDLQIDNVKSLPEDLYMKKVKKIKTKTNGTLIIKEYPTSQANTIHFKGLLNELFLKQKFKPNIIFVDYINICASARLRPGSEGMYGYIKAIAEELRGLAVEKELVLWTATQTNRTGYISSDVGLEDTAESFGLPATADFMFTLMTNETLEEEGKILIKQLKNRYNEISPGNRRNYIKVEKAKMKLSDATDEDQKDLPESKIITENDVPVMDRFKELKI